MGVKVICEYKDAKTKVDCIYKYGHKCNHIHVNIQQYAS